jgi:hypothetical protein
VLTLPQREEWEETHLLFPDHLHQLAVALVGVWIVLLERVDREEVHLLTIAQLVPLFVPFTEKQETILEVLDSSALKKNQKINFFFSSFIP